MVREGETDHPDTRRERIQARTPIDPLQDPLGVLGVGPRMEAATGFEPVIRALQARALPLGYAALALQGSPTN